MNNEATGIIHRIETALGNTALSNAIVYIQNGTTPAGTTVAFGDTSFTIPWDAHVAFVDLEPMVNWGHSCCYLAIPLHTGEVLRIDARMPPFLKSGHPPFRFLWRGPHAPEWAIHTED